MDFYSIIKNKLILDDNNFIVEEATYNKTHHTIDLYIVFDYALGYENYKALVKIIKEALEPLNLNDISLGIGYKDDSLNEEEMKEYLAVVLRRLAKKDLRYNSFEVDKAKIDGKLIVLVMPEGAIKLDELLPEIKEKFANLGFDIELKIELDDQNSIELQVNALNEKINIELQKRREEAEIANRFNNEIERSKKIKRNYSPDEITEISAIPRNASELNTFLYENGSTLFKIQGYIFETEYKEFPKTPNMLANIKITDETDSIIVQKWVKDVQKEAYKKDLKENCIIEVVGTAEYSSWDDQVIIKASSIKVTGIRKEDFREDNAPVKRVELHAFTKLNSLDGLVEPKDYLKIFSKWGYKAFAVADNSGLYAAPEINEDISKYPDLKPIYGIELPYIDDEAYYITLTKGNDIDLKSATYVVFDIETTGFSNEYDEIIEVAACKVRDGAIVSTYETFVNPHRKLSEKTTSLTSITDEDVANAPEIKDVLVEFFDYSKDCILVAHNAIFDVPFMYAKAQKYGVEHEDFPVIDTLNLFRNCYYNEVKKFNLEVLASYFKVRQEHHHRAIDDTRVTAQCFLHMLENMYRAGVTNYKDINNLIDKENVYRYLIPDTITLLALNPVGYKNLLKISSDAMTTHLYGSARVLKSVINAHREGILVGSSLDRSEIFERALNKQDCDLEAVIDYYDYIEILPPDGYSYHYPSLLEGKKTIEEVLKKIIRISKEHNKKVVAVSGSHYLNKNEKRYRDILIDAPQLGGGVHYLKRAVMIDHAPAPSVHLRTTDEMLAEFAFLGDELANEIVIQNTNEIADLFEKYSIFKPEVFAPRDDEFKDNLNVPSINVEMRRIVKENLFKKYGDNPHPIIKERVEKELESIIQSGYASVYYISHLLVLKSLSDGYLVGSRGSVGSSIIATMMNITEINPLVPHYYCSECKFHVLKMSEEDVEKYGITEEEEKFQSALRNVDSGYDLPDMVCPHCGKKLKKDGHDIPFETFLGFGGGKEPDIDLNFSGDYQDKAHNYIREVFGPDNAFRAGTVQTLAEKNAYGYVKGYCERNNISLRSCEIDRISKRFEGIKRSTGQHPGGIVVVPHYVDIFDVTPYQYPADKIDSSWRTTHYDYHKFEKNLLKFDILGHDDPTIIKFFMDYVKLHKDMFPFDKPEDIPVDDKNVYKLFKETSVIGLSEADIDSEVASFAIPEFGTDFVNGMLTKTKPQTFAELVKISGLSHGTNVWNSNAEDLVTGATDFGQIQFKKIIGCRDDIMVDLMSMGLEPLKSFEIMEFVRKNAKTKKPDKWIEYKEYMRSKNVPDWYIWSCERIEYMFPKAHATAYVLMALRIAWFKVYSPMLFYSGWFSKRASAHDVEAYVGGSFVINEKIRNLCAIAKNQRKAKEDDLITALRVALEMTKRGFRFLPVDINKSSATIFEIEEQGLRIPFVAIDGLGESVANDIVNARNQAPFTSKKDVKNRTKLSQTLYQKFDEANYFSNLPEKDKIETDGIFGFVDTDNNTGGGLF